MNISEALKEMALGRIVETCDNSFNFCLRCGEAGLEFSDIRFNAKTGWVRVGVTELGWIPTSQYRLHRPKSKIEEMIKRELNGYSGPTLPLLERVANATLEIAAEKIEGELIHYSASPQSIRELKVKP